MAKKPEIDFFQSAEINLLTYDPPSPTNKKILCVLLLVWTTVGWGSGLMGGGVSAYKGRRGDVLIFFAGSPEAGEDKWHPTSLV